MKGADTCKQLVYTFTRHFAVGMQSLLCVCVFLYRKLAGFKTDELANSTGSLGDREENAALGQLLWRMMCSCETAALVNLH